MREEKWTEQLGHRSRRPWCLVVHQGTVSRFVGADIPGVLAVVGTDYRKDGKWSSTTYRLAVADSAKLISGHMGWETGTFREGLRRSLLASPLDRWASIASALGVSVRAAEDLIRPWLPGEAAALDRVEEQMAALERAEEAAAKEAVTVSFAFGSPTRAEMAKGYWVSPKGVPGHPGVSVALRDPDAGWVDGNVTLVGAEGQILRVTHASGYHGGCVSITVSFVALANLKNERGKPCCYSIKKHSEGTR